MCCIWYTGRGPGEIAGRGTCDSVFFFMSGRRYRVRKRCRTGEEIATGYARFYKVGDSYRVRGGAEYAGRVIAT